MIRRLIYLLLSIATNGASSALAESVVCHYAYYHLDGGGLAEITVDPEAGKITGQRSVFHSPGNPMIEELVASDDGRLLALSNRQKDARSLYVLERQGDALNPRAFRVDLPQRADHLALSGRQIAAVGHKGEVYRIDAGRPGIVAGSVDLKRVLDIQDGSLGACVFSPDENHLLVLVGADSSDGRRRGGRIVVLNWPRLTVAHDIELPRDHPDLHYPEGSRERNPMPVAISLLPETNTAAIALSLYGAVALTDLDSLVSDGRLAGYTLLPTSENAEFGEGFPTILFPVVAAGRRLLLADNSGGTGGIAVLDPATRTRIAWLDTGLTSMGRFSMVDATRGVGNRAGVASKRGTDSTISSHSEQSNLVVIDFSPLQSGGQPDAQILDFEDYVYFSTPVGSPSQTARLLLGFFGTDQKTLENAIYDLDRQAILDRQPSLGVIRGFMAERP